MASSSDLINSYYENYPDSTEFIGKSDDSASTTLEQDVKALQVNETDKVEAFRKEFLNIGGPEVILNTEESAGGTVNAGITDKVAKESSDSTASTHELHDEANQATSGGNVAASAHKANPGPVKADNLPTPESKENLKKRAEELNK
ncbi:Nn.00g093790.m01.CDS01 [Neocucurbitaria sp. VM-36]